MRPDQAVTEFLYAHEYAEKNRRWYGGMLGNFASYCASQCIRDVGEITAPLSAGTSMWSDSAAILVPASPSAAKRSTAMFARSIGACVRTCSARACHGAWRCLGASRRSSRPSHPARSTVLMGAAETIRDKAIVALLLDTGLRARELCTLTIEHVHFAPDDVRLLVHGKLDKWREVGLGKRARQLLHRYIHHERPRGAMLEERRVSFGRRRPLTPSGLDQILYGLCDTVGRQHFAGIRVSAHTFRHSFAVNYLASGGDVYKLSRLLGHTAVTVTKNYLRAFTARAARQGASVFDAFGKRT